MRNLAKQVAQLCNRVQLPAAGVWSLSVVVLVVAGLCRLEWLGVIAGLVFLGSMAIAMAGILIEMSLVYRAFDRANRTWTTSWGHTFTEDHMPGRAARE